LELRERLGFRDGDRGLHTGRSMMYADIERLLDASRPDAGLEEFKRLAVEDNVLGKRTAITREHTRRKLKALYGLDPSIPVYRVMRQLWELDHDGRPLLALLCCAARDPLLRRLAPEILSAKPGAPTVASDVVTMIERMMPGRFSESSTSSLATHVLTSLTVAGHVEGRGKKTRARATPTPGSTAYALFLGFLEGARAQQLYHTEWAALLDVKPGRIDELARLAGQRGWIDYRNAGGVIEVRFPDLLTAEEQEWLRE
jgi:hypothetical protein